MHHIDYKLKQVCAKKARKKCSPLDVPIVLQHIVHCDRFFV